MVRAYQQDSQSQKHAMSTLEPGYADGENNSEPAASNKKGSSLLPTLLGLLLLTPLLLLVAHLNFPQLLPQSLSTLFKGQQAAGLFSSNPPASPDVSSTAELGLDSRLRLVDLEYELALLSQSGPNQIVRDQTAPDQTASNQTSLFQTATSRAATVWSEVLQLPAVATLTALLTGSSLAISSLWTSQAAVSTLVILLSLAMLSVLMVALSRRKARNANEKPSDQLIEGVTDGFAVFDKHRRVSAHNKRLEKLLPQDQQLPVSGATARTLYTQLCDDSTQVLHKLDNWLANLPGDRTSSIELPDRSNRQLLIRERPVENGVVAATVRDVSEQRLTQQQLVYANDYDLLTGLPNRALFMSHLRDLVRKPNAKFALMICDLRDFRQVNDSYGQQFGDRLLVETGQRLQAAMPEQAIVARLAGDEFAVLVDEADDHQQLERRAQDFLEAMGAGLAVGARTLPIRASMGISYSPQDGTTVGELKSAADSACARAKSVGKNSIASYSRRWQQVADRGHQLDIGLGKALANNEFQLQYQPQIDIKTNLTCGMEALLRWDSQSLGSVSPAEFIPRAERSDLIVEIGEWVLVQSIADYKNLARFGMSPATLSINISRRQFDNDELIGNIKRIIESSDIDPSLITLEITETAILDDRDRAAKLLGSLHDLGVSLSIDDFGVGYSSFLELRDFPIDEVKIDRTFVSDLSTCEQSRQIIKATVAVAASIGAEVVAEGIETRQQFEMVKALGCHRAQGYFLCEPMSATTFPDVCLGGNQESDNQFDATVAL